MKVFSSKTAEKNQKILLNKPFKPGYLMSKHAMKRNFLKPTIEKKSLEMVA
jgi:hypothetical protein